MEQTILPIAPQYFWAGVTLAGFLAATILVFRIMPHLQDARDKSPLERLQAQLGLAQVNGGAFFLLAAVWGLIFLMLVFGFLMLLWQIIWVTAPQTTNATWDFRFSLATLTALTATLGAVVVFPLTLYRLRLTRRQTDTADEALFNDKINAAAKDLAARRQVTRVAEQDGKELVLTEWEDDVVTRVVAIGRLEELARQNLDAHPFIVELLCVYIRANAPIDRDNDGPSHGASLEDWIKNHPRPRTDVQAALDVIGRRTDEQVALEKTKKYKVDLCGTNLRNCRLEHGNLSNAELAAVRFDGAILEGTSFADSNMNQARFRHAWAVNCDFARSRLQNAHLTGGFFHGATFNFADMFKVVGRGCHLFQNPTVPAERAKFYGANIADADFIQSRDYRGFEFLKESDALQSEQGVIFQKSFTSERTVLLLQAAVDSPSFDFKHLRSQPSFEHDVIVKWRRWRKARGFD